MALLRIDFHSDALKRKVMFNVILPVEQHKGPYRTLYLLHGLTDDLNSWVDNTRIRLWAEEKGIAVVMPSAENSFYLPVPVKGACLGDFGEYVGKELVEVTRKMFPLSDKREDTFIGGLSMGGYGSCRNGLKYHETFSKIAMMSAAVHFYERDPEDMRKTGDWLGEVKLFEDLEVTKDSDLNPRYLIKNMKKEDVPEIFMVCGTEDGLIRDNRSLSEFFRSEDVKLTYMEDSGKHDWYFWDKYIRVVFDWLLDDKK